MSNNNSSQPIYEQLVGLRDLVVLIEQQGANLPDVVYKLAIEKSRQISAMLEEMHNNATPATMEYPECLDWCDNAHNTIESVCQEICDKAVVADDELAPQCADNGAEDDNVVDSMDDNKGEESLQSEEPSEVADAVENNPDESEVSQLPQDETKDVADNEPKSHVVEPVVTTDRRYKAASTGVTKIEDVYRSSVAEGERTAVTLGDAMVAKRAKELRKALSLNDRFRFRRVLFAGNDADMNSVLEAIDKMDSYDKACDMLFATHKWDVNDEVVKEFLTIVELHFK